ncbi:hypothetical protein BGZ65_012826 [Modicella reniformis]|uniref:JmjC domain-containing protein n=1 Tax=Modicella reniformis TaxID=1440133 RepID=A0A9P6SNV2_9FUNG|nr:hypothetical protein BGZ65_012826 [Modicella reniformis]
MGENDLNGICPELAAENLMAYIGQNGTWTPAHIDHCGAIGHNIMICDDDGSSVWFIVSNKDMDKFEELCRSLGREPQYENSLLSVDDLSRANFPIYVAEQKTGDLVLIPSLSYHQVVNLGNSTIKVAWNRITASSARRALDTVLRRYRKINNPELFKIRSIIKNSLTAWTSLLNQQSENPPVSKEHFCQSFYDLLVLFRDIVEDDWIDLARLAEEKWTNLDLQSHEFHSPEKTDSNTPIVCDFCKCDCLFKYQGMQWIELVANPGYSFICPRCQNLCTCSKCKKTNHDNLNPIRPVKAPCTASQFTDPSTDPRNRGGAGDNMSHAFTRRNKRRRSKSPNATSGEPSPASKKSGNDVQQHIARLERLLAETQSALASIKKGACDNTH